jgi:hypothetical protein
MPPAPLLLLDVDGLRADVLAAGLEQGRLPNIARLLGGAELSRGLLHPLLAPAPSITFAAQACLFTGAHPGQHGIAGNQFFDRFGAQNGGVPRHYAFDVGDTLAVDDAVRVFSDGLAARELRVDTLYERLAGQNLKSVVASHMYARGAAQWLRPSLTDIARFTKGGNLFGLGADEYDRRTLTNTLEYIRRQGLPDVLTVYWMGVDHESHVHGPGVQLDFLAGVLDAYVGELWEAVLKACPAGTSPVVALFSDHGQIGMPADDRHSLRLAFPFEREMGHLFDALGLDVHDFPGEDPECDAVVASNGGMAQVYLQNRFGHWADAPVFERDVRPVGAAFWQAHADGSHAGELQGALAGVLLRNVAEYGWHASYQALTPAGDIIPLENWFAAQPAGLYADPVNRIRNMSGPNSGDLLLISNYADGFYFAAPLSGMHGGLHPQDSTAALALGWPGAPAAVWESASQAFRAAIAARCQAENNRQSCVTDLVTGLMAVLG